MKNKFAVETVKPEPTGFDFVLAKQTTSSHSRDHDFNAFKPDALLLRKSRFLVLEPPCSAEDSLIRSLEVIQEIEQTSWDQWDLQLSSPHLVPLKEWKSESHYMIVGDVVLVLNIQKVSHVIYKLTKVHPDAHGPVRTVTVGIRGKDDGSLPYVPRPLQILKLGVQRMAVILPVEEQEEDEQINASESAALGQSQAESDNDKVVESEH